MYKKLFIPGPTHVRESVLDAQTAPMIGHRSTEYSDLQAEVTPKLQKLLYRETCLLYYPPEGSFGHIPGMHRNSYPEFCPDPIERPGVASRLVMDVKAAAQERFHYFSGLNNCKRRHA